MGGRPVPEDQGKEDKYTQLRHWTSSAASLAFVWSILTLVFKQDVFGRIAAPMRVCGTIGGRETIQSFVQEAPTRAPVCVIKSRRCL